jgi:glycine oxidase
MEAAMSLQNRDKPVADVVVIGAGTIGLAIALGMHERGARVTVVERGRALGQASAAAAGMLAVDDPCNPAALLPLSRLSADLYPAFLRRVEALSGMAVPFQTETTLQYTGDGGVRRLVERSIDPRQLGAAIAAAVRATSIELIEHTTVDSVEQTAEGLRLRAQGGVEVFARGVVYAAGAWTGTALLRSFGCEVPVAPRKGQMLRVRLAAGMGLREVHRSEHVYVVPRTVGPQAGTALIGATVEDAGFDTTVHEEDLARLRGLAAELLPELGAEAEAPLVEAWAGVRPATPDELPVLGACAAARQFVASGHYRNGVLLTPATAVVTADLLMGKTPAVDLAAFSVERFSR